MRFRITTEYIKKQNRKLILIALLFFLLSVVSLAMLLDANSMSDIIIPIIGLYLFVPKIFKIPGTLKENAKSQPVLELNESEGKFSISHKADVVTVDIARLKNLRLQYTSKTLTSIIATTHSGNVLRLEGYENLEALASILEHLTPSNRITYAKFYHR